MLNIITGNFPLWLGGVESTLLMLFLAIILGLVFSLLFAWLKTLNIKTINVIIDTYIFVIRGTPFLLQLFIIYYGPFQFFLGFTLHFRRYFEVVGGVGSNCPNLEYDSLYYGDFFHGD